MKKENFHEGPGKGDLTPPEVLSGYLSSPADSVYRPVGEYNGKITREQALEDLEELIYLMDNRYCGKDFYERNGVCFSDIYAEIRGFILTQEQVYVSDFCRAIHGSFDCGIADNHLGFASPLTGLLRFSRQYAAYFADVLIEEENGRNLVIQSSAPELPAGSVIDSSACLFPTLAPKGRKRFLLGTRAWQPVQEMAVSVNGKAAVVPVHRCRTARKKEDNDVCLAEYSRNGIPVLRANCCDYVGGLTEQTDFEAMGRNYRDEQTVILNYLSNEGGYNRITREFVQGLNGYVHAPEYSMKLISPVTEGHDCRREWMTLSTPTPYEREKGQFDGRLIMLVNSGTASSGETAVLYGQSVKHFLLIGENTMGCNTFGNVREYSLKNSGILCRIPNVVNLCENPDDCREGIGFAPDFWVDSENVEEEVTKWLGR